MNLKSTFEEILKSNRQKVKEFYIRKGAQPKYGKYNINISCDGSYTGRSYKSIYESRYCISFAVENKTGTVVDYAVIERCNNEACKEQKQWTLNQCPDNNFHGASKSLEVSAAVKIYQQSLAQEYPFRYTVYVGDGDSNVIKAILKHNFYGDEFKIEKEECILHYRKSCRTNLYTVFDSARVFRLGKAEHRKLLEEKKLDFNGLVDKDWTTINPFSTFNLTSLSTKYANLILVALTNAVKHTRGSQTPESIKFMSNALRAIPRHYMDHVGASEHDRRTLYHSFCSIEFCKFTRLQDSEKGDYEPEKNGDLYILELNKKGERQTLVMESILKCFDKLGAVSVMSRCTRLLNQNINESLHSRCFRILDKTKFYKYFHVEFAAQLAMLIHNCGYEYTLGTLYTQFGQYFTDERKNFDRKDAQKKRNAGKRHQVKKVLSKYRGKAPLISGPSDYEPGFMYEDLELPGVAAFERLMQGRDIVLGYITDSDNEAEGEN